MDTDDDFYVGPHRIQVVWHESEGLKQFGTSRSPRRPVRFEIFLDGSPALNDKLRELADGGLPGADQLGRLLEQG